MAEGEPAAERTRSSLRVARVLGRGFALHLKMMMRSSFDGLLGVLWPLFFATIAFLMFRAGAGGESLVFASFGAAVMGIWSSTSTSAGSAMQRERWHGTLELLVSAPVHFATVLLPVTVAMSAMGLYSMVATLLWGRLAFGVDLPFEHPSRSARGRRDRRLDRCDGLPPRRLLRPLSHRVGAREPARVPRLADRGFLVPLTLLPGWVRPISWLLAPTWGVDAIRDAASGSSAWPEIALALGLGAVYLTIGIAVLETVLASARRAGSLALA